MKTTIGISVSLLTALTSMGQGYIDTRNVISGVVDAPIYGIQSPPYGDAQTRVYGGTPDHYDPSTKLSGAGFIAELWVGPDADHLRPTVIRGTSVVARMNFRTQSLAGRVGTILGTAGKTVAEVVGMSASRKAFAQMLVWQVVPGIDSWEDAKRSFAIPYGWSDVFETEPLAGDRAAEISQSFLKNLRSFNLINNVPEPAIVSLIAIGAVTMLIRRRASI